MPFRSPSSLFGRASSNKPSSFYTQRPYLPKSPIEYCNQLRRKGLCKLDDQVLKNDCKVCDTFFPARFLFARRPYFAQRGAYGASHFASPARKIDAVGRPYLPVGPIAFCAELRKKGSCDIGVTQTNRDCEICDRFFPEERIMGRAAWTHSV